MTEQTVQKPWLITTVRYGKMAYTAKFKTPSDRNDFRRMDKVIVRSDRGREVGTVLLDPKPMMDMIQPDTIGDILRRASADDVKNADKIDRENRLREIESTKSVVKKLNLSMKVIEVDHIFGGERLIIYFMSEHRIDFRELVRQLAHEFRTRIELKQVGARDQAKLVGDVGHCGLDLCCRTFLKELGGISMDMAKVQKHTADPTKITGRCGKLLCCLRYEYVAYTEARELLPPRGTRIQTKKGNGVVVDQNMLLREVIIFKEGTEERVLVKLEEILGSPVSTPGCNGCEIPKGGTATPEENKLATETGRFEPAAPAPAEFRKLGKFDEVQEGHSRVMDVDGLALAVYKFNNEIFVTENRCPHSGGPLGEGKLDGSIITCPLHQWKFDVKSGQCQHLPAVKLKQFESKVEGDTIFVKV